MRPGGGIIAVSGDLLSTPGRFDQDSPIAVVDTKSDPDSPHRHPGCDGLCHHAGRGDPRRPAERTPDHRPPQRRHRHPRARELPVHARASSPGCVASPGLISSPMRTTAGSRRPAFRASRTGPRRSVPSRRRPASTRSANRRRSSWTAPAISRCRSGRRAARASRRSWCSTPRPVGGRRGGRPRCLP